jgi:hypothetical protein
MKPRKIFKYLYNFPMMINVPILLQVLMQISIELTMCNHLGPFAPLVRVCFGDK